MTEIQKKLVDEHSLLVIKISKLELEISVLPEDMVEEHILMMLQLQYMRNAADILYQRLLNYGITYNNGKYVTEVAHIEVVPVEETIKVPDTETQQGSDYDRDSQDAE